MATATVPETERARRTWEKLAPTYDKVIRFPGKVLCFVTFPRRSREPLALASTVLVVLLTIHSIMAYPTS